MKPKIKHKFAAALVAAASLFTLSIQTLAAPTGSNAGGTYGPGHDYSGTPYGFFKSGDDFAWRVNLYVSARQTAITQIVFAF